jgi:hypothetical protein
MVWRPKLLALILSELNIDGTFSSETWGALYCTLHSCCMPLYHVTYSTEAIDTHTWAILIFYWAESLKLSITSWMLVDSSHSKVGFKSHLHSGGLKTHILCYIVWNHCWYYVLTCRVLDLVYLHNQPPTLPSPNFHCCAWNCDNSLVSPSRFYLQTKNVRFFILAVFI